VFAEEFGFNHGEHDGHELVPRRFQWVDRIERVKAGYTESTEPSPQRRQEAA